jgi:hypothetical protein
MRRIPWVNQGQEAVMTVVVCETTVTLLRELAMPQEW